jgi:hypothetical protein
MALSSCFSLSFSRDSFKTFEARFCTLSSLQNGQWIRHVPKYATRDARKWETYSALDEPRIEKRSRSEAGISGRRTGVAGRLTITSDWILSELANQNSLRDSLPRGGTDPESLSSSVSRWGWELIGSQSKWLGISLVELDRKFASLNAARNCHLLFTPL